MSSYPKNTIRIKTFIFPLIILAFIFQLLIACGGTQAGVNEGWTLVKLLTKGEQQEVSTQTVELRNCSVPEKKTFSCSAGTSKSLSVGLGGSLSGMVGAVVAEGELSIDPSIGAELGFDKSSEESLELEPPALGYIDRYNVTTEYRTVTGDVLARSSDGTEHTVKYAFQASCSLTIEPLETLPCEAQAEAQEQPSPAQSPNEEVEESEEEAGITEQPPAAGDEESQKDEDSEEASEPSSQIASPPEIIESGNEGVSITVYDLLPQDGDNNVHFQATAAGYPLSNHSFYITEAVQDISDRWRADEDNLFESVSTDDNGNIYLDLEAGTYAISKDDWISGSWGIEGEAPGYGRELIVFPVTPEKKTVITLSLGILEVGVLDDEGNPFTKGDGVEVSAHIQDTDIAGNKIRSERNIQGGAMRGSEPNAKGIATLFIGGGTYIVTISQRFTPFCEGDYFDIEIKPGEIRREVFTCECYNYTRSCID